MRPRLDRMLAHGATTVEVKTGYGLETETELRQLEAIVALDRSHPVTLVPTFLGAHAVPAEYKGRADVYVDVVIHEMLPAVAEKSRVLGLERLPFLTYSVKTARSTKAGASARRRRRWASVENSRG